MMAFTRHLVLAVIPVYIVSTSTVLLKKLRVLWTRVCAANAGTWTRCGRVWRQQVWTCLQQQKMSGGTWKLFPARTSSTARSCTPVSIRLDWYCSNKGQRPVCTRWGGDFFLPSCMIPLLKATLYFAVKDPIIDVTITIAAIVVPTRGDPYRTAIAMETSPLPMVFPQISRPESAEP